VVGSHDAVRRRGRRVSRLRRRRAHEGAALREGVSRGWLKKYG
jgi:hypothetical protein